MRRLISVMGILVFLSCTPSSDAPRKFVVATSVYPVYDIIKHIAGDVDALYAVPVGANPHTYEPLPSNVKRLRDVRVFIGVHPEFDGWLEAYLPETCQKVYLQAGDEEAHKHSVDHAHDENPHIWLSVRNAQDFTRHIAAICENALPERRTTVRANLERYLGELDALDDQLALLFRRVRNRAIIQWHPAWDRFAHDYGLEIVGTVEHGHGDTPSVKAFKELVERSKNRNVRVIVIGLNVESKAVSSLAQETGASVIRLDTIGDPANVQKDTYIRLMLHNGRQLADALNR